MPFGTACCAIEFMATAAARFDLARFGMERMSFSPRQADVLICAGRVPFKLAPVIRRIYQQMLQPKWVISMGACASTGGMFDNYAVVQGIDTIIPVDVYVPVPAAAGRAHVRDHDAPGEDQAGAQQRPVDPQ
jgi:NADH-quinone oxidoreductase subunit B